MMPAMKSQNGYYLSDLLQGVCELNLAEDRLVNSVQIDSRCVTTDDLFIALPGSVKHGLEYLQVVMNAGACCVLYQQSDADIFRDEINACPDNLILVAVESIRDIAGVVISRFYDNASESLQVTGVTGTDGKTSVSRFLAQALSAEMKTALIGTTGNGLWGQLTPASHTTPDVLSLHKILFELKNKSAEAVVMEVSSHGIEQQRIAGVDINTAVLTNITRDHLDYHGTVENYREVKKQLFLQDSVKNIVVNLDDAVGLELAETLSGEKNTWGYSLKQQVDVACNTVCVKSVEVHKHGFVVEVITPDAEAKISIPLLGRFNIANVLSVLCVLLINKISLKDAVSRIEELETAPGRMEMFSTTGKSDVVVDFAHTPKALELALRSLKEHCKGRIICVFGCGGDRDQGKRPLMGSVAEKFSDLVVLTDDNPRSESSEDILQQILTGIEDKNKTVVIADRMAAIEYACDHALADDVVLVAGKGHEEYQLVGDKKIRFSDREVVKKLIGGNQS